MPKLTCEHHAKATRDAGLRPNEVGPMHFHIRWSSGKLDWERYTRAEAEEGAGKLIRQEQTYVVEGFSDTGCPRCREP
jgi:hypothetical protein